MKINLKIRRLLLKNSLFYLLTLIVLFTTFIRVNLKYESVYDINDSYFEGIVTKYDINGDKLSIVINAKEKIKCTYYIDNEDELEYLNNTLKYGSYLSMKGILSEPRNNTVPNTFNYKKYLYNHQIYKLCRIESFDINNSNINILYKIKNSIIDRIKTYTIKDYLMTFIIGDKSLLDENVFNNYRKNGVTHLFAISGMHIGLFSVCILTILKKLKFGETKRYVITMLFLLFYSFITGFSPSVLRATTLFCLLALNKIFYTEVKTLNVLLLTGSILLLINPFILIDIGFEYSFLTTFGLIYGSTIINKHKLIGTSLVASLFSLPITINNFYSFNLFSLINNLIFVPLVSSIIYPLCLLSFLFKPLSFITSMSIIVLEFINKVCSNITFFTFVMPKMPIILIIIYYLVLLSFLNKKFKLCLKLSVIIISVNKLLPVLDTNWYVTILDVGQGDSILIISPHQSKVIIVDTGGIVSYSSEEEWAKKNKYYVTDNTITYLYSLGISKLDYLILTHGDYDHMGESLHIIENIKVKNVIFNIGDYNNLEKELIEVLNKKNINYSTGLKDLIIEKDFYFLTTRDYFNENANSNVLYAKLYNTNFLFMGDANIQREEDILKEYDLPLIDFLKVGHHGSNTSSSEELIDKIKPVNSLISVGENNKYDHPKKSVLTLLDSSNIYRTDREGSIVIEIDKKGYKICTNAP